MIRRRKLLRPLNARPFGARETGPQRQNTREMERLSGDRPRKKRGAVIHGRPISRSLVPVVVSLPANSDELPSLQRRAGRDKLPPCGATTSLRTTEADRLYTEIRPSPSVAEIPALTVAVAKAEETGRTT